jgi:recombination protein RecT
VTARTNALVKDKANFSALLQSEQVQSRLLDAAPKHFTPAKIASLALGAAAKNPKIYECTAASVLQSIIHAAQLGLKFDSIGGEGHLVPYGKKCTFIPGYQGLLKLARQTGDISTIHAEVVCENDNFEWVTGSITHEVDWRNPRGGIQAVYAICKFKDGGEQSAVMTLEEVNTIRDSSPGAAKQGSPWNAHYNEMAKKTVLRRLLKTLPQSVDLQSVLENEQILEQMIAGDRQQRVSPIMKHIMPDVPAEDVNDDSETVEVAEGDVVDG